MRILSIMVSLLVIFVGELALVMIIPEKLFVGIQVWQTALQTLNGILIMQVPQNFATGLMMIVMEPLMKILNIMVFLSVIFVGELVIVQMIQAK